MKLDGIKCDCCGRVIDNIAALHWESRPSVFRLNFPRDGINGGDWNMDVCQRCRHDLFDAIQSAINGLRKSGQHSIHCAGYRGPRESFDEAECDCCKVGEFRCDAEEAVPS